MVRRVLEQKPPASRGGDEAGGGPAEWRLSRIAWASVVTIGNAHVAARVQEAPQAEAATEQPATTDEQPTTEVLAETNLFAPEQPDILVAPVALYSDPLLVLVLQGSTFRVEVVAANRFLGKLRRC
jgi:hypothetical protein